MYVVFDLDGTLVKSSREITETMLDALQSLKDAGYKNVIVSGGTYEKIKWQIKERIDLFDLFFPENGALVYKNDKLIKSKKVTDLIEPSLLNGINNRFEELCDEKGIGFMGKRVDIRNGLIYLTCTGTEASLPLREEFILYNQESGFILHIIDELQKIDKDNKLEIVKGGKTGISVYPKGMDKTQIFEVIKEKDLPVYFFGDNCKEDGNDYCLYKDSRCIGHEVKDYHHTIELLKDFDKKH